ncbi:unnamed protein product [Mytilus coruscus]|uniref:Uncharacterized protein n=1 Tax=Mytilus coruscus TaxID=42192 RepID=A0A6J8E5Q8_MYTCO|nr:unnamed protein product [Mytilus coruscus]
MPRRKNWRAAEAKRVNLSHNQNEQSELNQNELSELNQLELPELNQLELSELNQLLELPELNQLELSELNELELPELNQNSYNTYAKETSHSSHKQTNILSNQSKNSYAKKDSPSMILTDLLQNQSKHKNNSEQVEHSVSTDNDDQAVLSKSQVYTKVFKFVYTKDYMQNRKIEEKKTYREKERQRVLNSKRNVRKDEDFRKADAESKKSQRNNSDLRQKRDKENLLLKR